ncbi:MAG: hypothetical protein GC181_16450 [Bacteroidetes bacterium]|nr:hypothetical protein [Bacteroidota bacterium]
MMILSGCRKSLTPTEYFNFYNTFQPESFLECDSKDLVYKLQHRPSQFQALNFLKGSGDISKETVTKLSDSAGDDRLYCLRIELKNKEDDILRYKAEEDADYYNRIELLTAEFPFLIQGIVGEDTLGVALHHFERAYKLRPFINITFSMAGSSDELPDKILFHDWVFQNGEIIEFDHVNTLKRNQPKLSI